MKQCSLCKEYKPLDMFYKDRRKKDGCTSSCKNCQSQTCKKWRDNNHETYVACYKNAQIVYKEQYKAKRRFTRYGLTADQYSLLLQQQANRCAICQKDFESNSSAIHIDHDHVTGKVRGLLCLRCNTGLPLIENTVFKTSAENYLARAGVC